MATREEIFESMQSQKISRNEAIRQLEDRKLVVEKEIRRIDLKEDLAYGLNFTEIVKDWDEKFKGGKFIQKPDLNEKELSTTYAKTLHKMLAEDGESLGDFIDRLNKIIAQGTVEVDQLRIRKERYQEELKLIKNKLPELYAAAPAEPFPAKPTLGE